MNRIKTKKYRKFLTSQGYVFDRIKGDHEIWKKKGSRPVVFVGKEKEVPVFHIGKNNKTIGLKNDEYERIVSNI